MKRRVIIKKPCHKCGGDTRAKGGDAEKTVQNSSMEGRCTGTNFGGPDCPPGSKQYELAKTFRKIANSRSRKKYGGDVAEQNMDTNKLLLDRKSTFKDILARNNSAALGEDVFLGYLMQDGGGLDAYGYDPDAANIDAYIDQMQTMESQEALVGMGMGDAMANLEGRREMKLRTKMNPMYKAQVKAGTFPMVTPDQYPGLFEFMQKGGGVYRVDHPGYYQPPEGFLTQGIPKYPYGLKMIPPVDFGVEPETVTATTGEDLTLQSPLQVGQGDAFQRYATWEAQDQMIPGADETAVQYSFPGTNEKGFYKKEPVETETVAVPEYPSVNPSYAPTPQMVEVNTPVDTKKPVTKKPAAKTSHTSKAAVTKPLDVSAAAKSQEALNETPKAKKRRGNVFDDDETPTVAKEATVDREAPRMGVLYPKVRGRKVPFAYNPEETYLSQIDFRKPFLRPNKQGAIKSMTFTHRYPRGNEFANHTPIPDRSLERGRQPIDLADNPMSVASIADFINRFRGSKPQHPERQFGGDWTADEFARTKMSRGLQLDGAENFMGPGMDFLAMIGNRMTTPDLRKQLADRTAADNVFTPGFGDRGFNTFNKTGFDPVINQTPVQFTGMRRGGEYQLGGSYELSEKEIEAFLKAGGEIEYA